MSDSALDMIDHVVGRHGDAMRWSPDPLPTPPPGPQAHAQLAAAWINLFEEIAAPFRQLAEALVTRLAPAVAQVAAEQQRLEAARSVRLRRMRHLYRQRRR